MPKKFPICYTDILTWFNVGLHAGENVDRSKMMLEIVIINCLYVNKGKNKGDGSVLQIDIYKGRNVIFKTMNFTRDDFCIENERFYKNM